MRHPLKIALLLLGLSTLTINKVIPLSSGVEEEKENLILNPSFEFHSFMSHRTGIASDFKSHNVAFWNTEEWGDIEVIRESHVSKPIRPDFSTHNLVAISPGKKIWQFFTLPEAGLSYGDELNLSVHGYQKASGQLKSAIKVMKTDSEDGEWSPKDFGMKDSRSFPKHSRGELVVAKEYSTQLEQVGRINLMVENASIIGKAGVGNISGSKDINTVGIQVEFENMSLSDTVWVYAPRLSVKGVYGNSIHPTREMRPNYRYIPRTIQKLWKGEVIHVIVMGSSIDRGSANPPMYMFDEDPSSSTFKQPLSGGLFDAEKAGREDLDGYYGEWRHYYSYAGRLKLELMRKFNLTPDKICLNFMAADGSSIGESHSGLQQYFSLSIPPNPGLNGHKEGGRWEDLYPDLFSRREGARPDLVIFGSGANEKTDTPDEVAVFEGAIRWIQQNYPHTEFLFSPYQNQGKYTPNTVDLQALSLRYQIPYMDYPKIADDLTGWGNKYSLVPSDGHPQAASHYLWFKQLEKAFECWNPIFAGQAQLQMPERLHPNSYGWEGDMITFDSTSQRIKTNRFIFEDNAINSWGKTDSEPPVPYVDGEKFSSRRSSPSFNLRNSMFRYGRTSLGDRHILEIAGENAKLTYVDSKINPNRRFFPVSNPNWNLMGQTIEPFHSEWGAPYGTEKISLKPGKYIEIEVVCTDISVAWVDHPDAGTLEIFVDDQLMQTQACNIGFTDTDKKVNYLENRKGILNLGFGLHKIQVQAKDAAVDVLSLFSYDSRSNLSSERRLTGLAVGGETLEFTQPFKTRPLVICSGDLSVDTEDISSTEVRFSGSNGGYIIIGE
ncbi:hypothetical protein [Cyclobacterium marinum]|uniref:Uncharacterized protein n=1 Tax=Cyclobacterium marinum (strain ATCC 25205 / DSM 745 / LMG 13164 / NCIMB 1802) TaxID=880070 RepID=G0J3H8_CYCMS|nr:hypothetical protein [Cyclobacterium marinum]AEL24617.1 hypothetical protein Cycma_0844 [Cyclobacterium marinum DSM 745]